MTPSDAAIEALAKILAECPYLYTVDGYGAVGPGEESVEAYAQSGGVAEWLIARGVQAIDGVGSPQDTDELLGALKCAEEWPARSHMTREERASFDAITNKRNRPLGLGSDELRAALKARDVVWCQALLGALDTKDIERVLVIFNRERPRHEAP